MSTSYIKIWDLWEWPCWEASVQGQWEETWFNDVLPCIRGSLWQSKSKVKLQRTLKSSSESSPPFSYARRIFDLIRSILQAANVSTVDQSALVTLPLRCHAFAQPWDSTNWLSSLCWQRRYEESSSWSSLHATVAAKYLKSQRPGFYSKALVTQQLMEEELQ